MCFHVHIHLFKYNYYLLYLTVFFAMNFFLSKYPSQKLTMLLMSSAVGDSSVIYGKEQQG